jgi:hypothetical protein
MDTTTVDERAGFARDYVTGHWSMTELCERYGVTRPTATSGWRGIGRAETRP